MESKECLKLLKKHKLNYLAELLEKDKERSFLFTAIETCKTKGDKIRFIEEYTIFMKKMGDNASVRKNARQVALGNIGYAVGYYGEKERKAWYSLKEVRHPIFGVC